VHYPQIQAENVEISAVCGISLGAKVGRSRETADWDCPVGRMRAVNGRRSRRSHEALAQSRVRDPTGIGKARSDWRFNFAGRVSLRRYLHFQCNSRLFPNVNLWVMHSSEEGNEIEGMPNAQFPFSALCITQS
jgi:hypothetical protein